MRVLVFTNTPAHVHVYKHAVAELERRGHEVLVLARDYGCTVALLDWYDLPYRVFGSCGTTQFSLLRRLPGHYVRMVLAARRFDPDVVFGYGAYAAHTGFATGARTVLVTDSEPETLDVAVSRPFVDAILTPDTYRKDLGPKHYVFDGVTECAYLHPDVFTPRTDVRDRLGVGDDRFVLLRFNAFGSHHDVGRSGLSPAQRRTLIERLAQSAVVFVSDEGGEVDLSDLPARRYDLHPALLHDVLAEAALLVADTQTMVTEAALLATPAIRSNDWVGEDDMGNFVELAAAGLIFNLSDFDDVLSRATALLTDADVPATWRTRRDAFMADRVNLTELLVAVATTDRSPDGIDSLGPRTAAPVPQA
jgi:predicted glycosyltransferase